MRLITTALMNIISYGIYHWLPDSLLFIPLVLLVQMFTIACYIITHIVAVLQFPCDRCCVRCIILSSLHENSCLSFIKFSEEVISVRLGLLILCHFHGSHLKRNLIPLLPLISSTSNDIIVTAIASSCCFNYGDDKT